MEIRRTFDLLERYKNRFNKEDAFVAKENGTWVKYSSEDYINNSHNISYGLLALGIKKGDKIATITNNRPEWNFLDMGIAMIGAVHVPIFTSLNENEYKHTLNHSESKLVFVSDKSLYNSIYPIVQESEVVNDIYTLNEIDGAKNWKEILELGKKHKEDYKEEVEKIKKEISPDDLLTIIYTSGTTGASKGVMLSHENAVHNALAASKGVFNLRSEDKFLSILPLCHVGGKMSNYQTQYSGTSIYYAESMGAIAKNMKEIKPDGFDTVPRILEKVYDNVIANGKKLKGIKKTLFFWAVKLGLRYNPHGENGPFYTLKHKIADKLIFSKWREVLGGNIRIAGCGGSSLQPRLERIFWAAGIKILNMYGLTETSPIITINRQSKGNVRLGTVGALIDGVEAKLADDGEILCKGKNVMMGYYKNPELTKSAFDEEGWFKTGDIGSWEKGKFLKVTDRKKEIFKLSGGKYVAPQVIENKFKESILIEHIMVIGEHEKFASALISPNVSYLKDWGKTQNISYNNVDELIRLPKVLDSFNQEVKSLNKDLSNHEKILRFKLVSDEWSPATGELSPTLKLKRKFINKKYTDLTEQIYTKKDNL